MSTKNATLNSIMILTAASLLNIILHELAHYLTAVALGYDATLFHNRVVAPSLRDEGHAILFAAAGPVYSLLQGIVVYRFAQRQPAGPVTLFLLWLGLTGLLSFFGYLMIAPLVPVGDTGRVFALLGVPLVAQIAGAVFAIAIITWILIRAAAHFEKFVSIDFRSDRKNRQRWSYALLLIPILVSTLAVTLLQLPVQHFISIIATVCAPFAFFATFGTFIGTKQSLPINAEARGLNASVSTYAVIALIILVAVFRILASGVL